MAFWNAPNAQPDHCERACRAALQAKDANEIINRRFEEERLPRFYTRFGIHIGEAVVGNLGSSERMNAEHRCGARVTGLPRGSGGQTPCGRSRRE